MNKKFLNAVLFGALLASSAGTFTSCKDYDDDIDGLQEQIDANQKTLDEKLATLQTALDAAKTELAAAKAAAAKAQETADAAAKVAAAAQEAAAQAKIDAINKATELVNELKTVVNGKVDKSVYDTKMGALDGKIQAIEGRLTTIDGAISGINTQLEALNGFKTIIEDLNLTTAFPDLVSRVNGLETTLNGVKSKAEANETSISDIKSQLTTISGDINAISSKLNTLSALLSQRLTALTFAPTQFINGIEVINFATLNYKAWTDVTADNAPTAGNEITINNGKTEAVYFASPSSAEKEDLAGATVLLQNAANTITRADSKPAVEAEVVSLDGGKMIVNLKKNIEAPFLDKVNDDKTKEEFTLLALSVNIKQTAEEVKGDIQPTVVSDWARLVETKATPYIHYTKYIDEKGAISTEEEKDDAIPHFYNYKTIHSVAGSKVAADKVCDTKGKYIIEEIAYNTTGRDLNELVTVCDKEGNLYKAENYGLKFKFEPVPYLLVQEKEEPTNQANFVDIDENGVITSRANDGTTTNNQDAIGREPMIMVKLIDTEHGDKVVDVRYFKLKWSAAPKVTPLDELTHFDNIFDCVENYTNTVGTDIMNNMVYTKLNISNPVFHSSYTLDTKLYSTEADVEEGKNAITDASIEDIKVDGGTVTHNLKSTYPNFKLTAAEYEAGETTKVVYGRFINNLNDKDIVTFSLKLKFTFDKMVLDAGYNETYWDKTSGAITPENASKKFTVNPSLTSDATYGYTKFYDCRINTSLLNGYAKGAQVVSDINKLVLHAEKVAMYFDKDAAAFKNLPVAKASDRWTVVDGNKLMYNGVTAAEIEANGVIKLTENPYSTGTYMSGLDMWTGAKHGEPTAGAQLLLGSSVPVKLVAENCMISNINFDKFLVNFIKPLTMTVDQTETVFTDIVTGGSSIDIKDAVTIVENFGDLRTVWKDGKATSDMLKDWYNLQGIYWDLANAKTNLKVKDNGIVVSGDFNNKWTDFANFYILKPDASVTPTKLTFENKSGSALSATGSFQVKVPVYVGTKWNPTLQDADMMMVTLTVNPGNGVK